MGVTCHMCGEEKKPCKAHIIPDGLKHTVEDEGGKHHFVVNIPKMSGHRKETFLFDKNILCRECDASLGRYDQYLIVFIRKFNEAINGAIDGDFSEGNYIHIDGNKKNLEAACAATLWRMSITSHKEFKHVSLGEKYTDEIRNYLRTGEMSNELRNKFSIFLYCCKVSENNLTRIIVPSPISLKINSFRHYGLYISGVNIVFCIGDPKMEGFTNIFPKLHTNDAQIKMFIARRNATLLNLIDRQLDSGLKKHLGITP